MPSPRDRPTWSLSLSSTRSPLAMDTSAMPAPISPAPRMPIVSTLRVGSPNGFFLAAVAPKKMPRSAADSGVAASLPKSSRSSLEPTAWPPSSPALAHSRMAGGAGYLPLVCFCIALPAWSNSTLRPMGVFSRNQSIQPSLRLRGLIFPSAASTAVAMADRSNAFGSTTESTSPIFLALAGRTCSPVSIIWIAVCAPTSLGRRCVPPAPGSRPSITCRGRELGTRAGGARGASRAPALFQSTVGCNLLGELWQSFP
mmetsp:Transcript_12704/g.41576  ORF Transcript_12704/g.41576 Transcript_12704/m.41576 type:complete len:256 (+) Transcript_12704:1345-2112(+)